MTETILDESAISEIEARYELAKGAFHPYAETAKSLADIPALCATVKYLRAELATTKGHWADTSEDLASAWLKNGELQSQLEQLRDELAEEKRLRAELKQIAQIGISEVSSVGTVLKDNAVTDFRSRAIQLCKDKAAEYRALADDSLPNDQTGARLAASARTLHELATELEKL